VRTHLLAAPGREHGARPPRLRDVWPRAPWAWLAAWAAALPVALIRARYLSESDTFWEIRTGQVILRTGHIPAADTFSWWARGRPWAPNSWAFDVLLAAGYRVGGLACVALLGSALVMVACAAILLLARRLGGSAPAAGVGVFAWSVTMFLWLSVRPQLTDYAAVPLLVLVMARAGPAVRPRTLLVIAAIQAVWVNLHTAALLGIPVVFCAGLGTQAGVLWALPACGGGGGESSARGWEQHSARRAALRTAATRAVAPALAALAGTLANPRGPAVFAQLREVNSASTGLVAEWQHLSLSSPSQLVMLGAGVLAIAVAARRRRFDEVLVLAMLAAAGAYAIRNLPILDAAAVAVLAVAAGGPRLRAWTADRARVIALQIMAVGVVGALAVRAVSSLPHAGATIYPIAAVRALPSGCRLFNSYLLGGIVILERPGVPVSIDSRNDLYGRRAVLTEQRILTSRSGGPGVLRRLGVTCVLIPAATGLAGQLRRSPAWRQVTGDPAGTVFVRRGLFARRGPPTRRDGRPLESQDA
jgi:hypothetical protein